MTPSAANLAICLIVGLATAAVMVRPFDWAEAVWAIAGAALLLAGGLIGWAQALSAIAESLDVCLFLIGMMLLAEIARYEGLFDWLAAFAVNQARRSPGRLFALVYAAGVVVTVFLSNDATAVVLTPAVFAAAKKARADPLAYVFVCAFIANAASFVLPISNPANLVLYAGRTPPLGHWLASFLAPSIVSIAATYVALRWALRAHLADAWTGDVEQPPLTSGGRTALIGIGATAILLLVASALGQALGPPTLVLALATGLVALARNPTAGRAVVGAVTWSIAPLVAGLFVMVRALAGAGPVALLATLLRQALRVSVAQTAAAAGLFVALAGNLVNNLPAGLIASSAVVQSHAPHRVVDALLIGVDVGPNLSITGSLATLLWLRAVPREGQSIGFWRFLRLGAVVMPPALIMAIGVRLLAR